MNHRYRVSLITGVILALCFFGRSKIASEISEWRFERALSAAVQYEKTSLKDRAEDELELAWLLSDQSVQQLRRLIELGKHLSSEQTLQMAQALVRHTEATEEDIYQGLKLTLERAGPNLYTQLKSELPLDQMGESTRIQYLDSCDLVAKGQPLKAIAQLEAILDKSAENKDQVTQLLVALLQEQVGNPFSERRVKELTQHCQTPVPDLIETAEKESHHILQQLQTFFAESKLEDAEQLIEVSRSVLDKVIAESLLMGIAFKKGDTGQQVYHRSRALQAAGYDGTIDGFLKILKICRRFGDTAGAEKVAGVMAELPARIFTNRQVTLLVDQHLPRDSEKLRQFYQNYHAAHPQDPVALQRYVISKLASGSGFEEIEQLIGPQNVSDQGHPSIVTSLALAYAVEGHFDEAKALLVESEFDWNQQSSCVDRAIYATVLSADPFMLPTASRVRALCNEDEIPRSIARFLESVWAK